VTIHVHELAGCAPQPLGHYLKALGVLRLVAEQKDPDVRGWWKNERFWLATSLDRDALERFFLHEYAPTPILAPWNLGSGFYYEEDEGLTPIETSRAARFGPLRAAIQSARSLASPFARAVVRTKAAEAALGDAKEKKASAPELEGLKAAVAGAKVHQAEIKGRLVSVFRKAWRGALLAWFDAALVLTADSEPRYPALLGTGGNDGRLDFTNNNLQHLARLFELTSAGGGGRAGADLLLRASLSGVPAIGLTTSAVGQFLPGTAGGANMAAGFDGTSQVNSWDFVLMLEGSVLFASGVSRRAHVDMPPQAAAPFAVRARAVGYGSAASGDESARGEQWFPLWSSPTTLSDLSGLIAEGRSQLGRSATSSPVDFARAVARLGVARGVDAFERYGYIERNGQSNLATPLGRWVVAPQPHQELLDDVDSWLYRARGAARGDKAASLRSAVRRADEAVLDLCRAGGVPERWQTLLIALADIEAAFVRSPKKTADERLRPIPPLSAGWVEAASDGGAEVRLALALASQHATWHPTSAHPVREHWSPVGKDGRRFAASASGLAIGPEVVCGGLDLERDCIALVRRRVMHARAGWRADEARLEVDNMPLVAAPGCTASLADLDAFLRFATDDARILGLARALMALNWERWAQGPWARVPHLREDAGALHAILRLVHLPGPLRRGADSILIAIDPEVVPRLAAGDLSGAVAIALRRLRASGLRSVVREVAGDARLARRLAASLAFPIPARDVDRCADLVTKPYLADAGSASFIDHASEAS